MKDSLNTHTKSSGPTTPMRVYTHDRDWVHAASSAIRVLSPGQIIAEALQLYKTHNPEVVQKAESQLELWAAGNMA